MRWYVRIGRKVWFREVGEFLFGQRARSTGISLGAFRDQSATAPAHDVKTPARSETAESLPQSAIRMAPVFSSTLNAGGGQRSMTFRSARRR